MKTNVTSNIIIVSVNIPNCITDEYDIIKFRILVDNTNFKRDYVDRDGYLTDKCISIVNKLTNNIYDHTVLQVLSSVEFEYLEDIPKMY